MQFCKKCENVIIPKKTKGKTVLICNSCGAKQTTKKRVNVKIENKVGHTENKVIVVEKKKQFEVIPKTDAECQKCGHKKAYWWMQQTRAGDEPPTRFYKCAKCEHIWREYE